MAIVEYVIIQILEVTILYLASDFAIWSHDLFEV